MGEGLFRTAAQKQSGSGITRRTLGGLFWTFLGTGMQAGLQLLVLVILARLLTPADFGVVTAALVVVGFSTIFSQLGIGPAVVQRPDLTAAHLRTGFTISFLLGGSLAGLIWICAPVIAAFFRVDGLTPVLRALALIFPLQGISVVAESLMQRELRFRWLSAIEVITVTFGYGAVGIALALLGLGVWALVGAHLAQTVLKTVLLLLFQPHPMLPLLERRAARELMYFGGGFTAARVGNYLATYGDNLVIGRCLGAEALGIYGRAYQLVAGPAMLFGGVLDRVLFPAMAKVQDCPERLAAAYRRGIALIALMLLPASAVLLVLAPELIHVLLGPEWSDVVIPLRLLSASLLFRTSYRMSDSLVRATGAVYRRAWRQAVFAGLVVAGSLVGQFWGLPGVSIGVVVAITVNFFLMAQLSLNLTTLTWRDFWKAHVPGLALGMLIGFAAWLVAAVFRAWSFSPPVVLIASVVAVLPSFLLPRYLPQLFLGQDGRWMFRTLAEYLPLPGRAVYSWREGDRIGGPSYQRS